MINNETSNCGMIKDVIEEFSRLQSYMELADEDTSVYELMLKRYYELKTILIVCNVDLTELDRISERGK